MSHCWLWKLAIHIHIGPLGGVHFTLVDLQKQNGKLFVLSQQIHQLNWLILEQLKHYNNLIKVTYIQGVCLENSYPKFQKIIKIYEKLSISFKMLSKCYIQNFNNFYNTNFFKFLLSKFFIKFFGLFCYLLVNLF